VVVRGWRDICLFSFVLINTRAMKLLKMC
jgi:hypothetical protein